MNDEVLEHPIKQRLSPEDYDEDYALSLRTQCKSTAEAREVLREYAGRFDIILPVGIPFKSMVKKLSHILLIS